VELPGNLPGMAAVLSVVDVLRRLARKISDHRFKHIAPEYDILQTEKKRPLVVQGPESISFDGNDIVTFL
jgi:hypothetical protein